MLGNALTTHGSSLRQAAAPGGKNRPSPTIATGNALSMSTDCRLRIDYPEGWSIYRTCSLPEIFHRPAKTVYVLAMTAQPMTNWLLVGILP